jgi:molybdenum cofactor guanylyltransferase
VNAYVLTGGRSKRMGASKVELFLPRVLDAARPVFDDVIAVHRPDGAPLQVRTIFEEPHQDDGAIFGVVRALRDAAGPCFVLAVDYPFVTSEVLSFLRDDGRVPEWNGVPQPLCAVWNASMLPRLEERIAARRYDLRGAVDREIIPEPELRMRFGAEVLLNVNTPEEWERGQRFLASR